MNSKSFWATTTAFFALSAVGPRHFGARAQTTTMATCASGFSWNENSLGQDPCEVSSLLDAACRGVGSYTIPPLNSTQNYVPPQASNVDDITCDCNTVMYSLYMACTSCQGGVLYSWTTWIAQCTSVYVTQYNHNVPYGTAIPHWAFYNVTTLPNETYEDSVAMSVGDTPESTAKPLNTATYQSTSSTHFNVPTTTSGSNSNPNSNSGSNNSTTSSKSSTPLAAIIGGVVGGVVLISGAVLTLILINRRKRNSGIQPMQPPMQAIPSQDMMDYQKVQPMSPSALTPATANLPYNTTTSPGPFNPPTSPGSQYSGMPAQNPQYGGMPAQNQPYGGMPGQNPPYGGMPTQNPAQGGAGFYNPDDPTTFPSSMVDGQSSVAYTTNGGPGRYGGVPEL